MPSPAQPENPAGRRAASGLLGALPYAVFVLLALVSWNRWIEPYVDSGRELSTPWRLSRGEALYRDVRFYHGPLAPYLAAAIDRAFGPSLPGRIALGAAIALAALEALRRLATRLLSTRRGALVTALIVASCFFQRPGGCYLFPFSFDTSLAVAAIAWALLAASGRQSAGGDRFAAACLLAALLCRPELGLAAIAALAIERASARRLIVPVLLPLGLAAAVYAALSVGTPLATLRREGWLAVVGPPETFRNIYAAYAGVDRPALRLAELALAAVVLLLFGCLLAAASALAARARRGGALIGVTAVAALLAIAAVCLRPPETLAPTLALFPPLVRVVPLLLIAAAVLRLARRLSGRGSGGLLEAVPDAILLVSALFGARVLLAAGYTGPYSAFLMPLALLVASVGLYRLVERAAPALGATLPGLTTVALAVLLLFRAGDLARIFRHPGWTRVSTPAGPLVLTEPVAGATRDALQDLAARLPDGGTLTGFPEGGFFNYALGLSNPLAQDQFFPGHLNAGAEAEAIERLLREPPDAILYANVLAVGHRAVRFGSDYLRDLDRFVRENFEVAASYGPGAGSEESIGDPQFFVEIRVPSAARRGRP